METGNATLIVGLVIAVLLAVIAVALIRRAPQSASPAATDTSGESSPGVSGASVESAVQSEREQENEALRVQAQREAEEIREKAREDADESKRRTEAVTAELKEHRLDLERREQRVGEREDRLHAEAQSLEERAADLSRRATELETKESELAQVELERIEILERAAEMTADQAKAELVATIEAQAKREGAILARDIEREASEHGQAKAREIITLAIQRLASEQTAESVVSVLHLPGDEMKGRIIGREGRNIRAFEQITGVNVIIDDTPEAVLLSCFDPVRREVARLTLEELVLDGRIHPHRIEEQYEKSRDEVEALCVRAGEDALVEVGVADVHPDLVVLLGRLRYRTSYGQNVLKHLTESAHLAGMMAAELGLDVAMSKRCAMLHDIGKALTHEVDGSHALIGAEVARRYGENDDVVHAIEAHHNEVEVRTVEAVLTQAADAISGSRPGARRESLEAYVKRLERLEEISKAHEGVDKVFAMQAGRELRVMVLPDVVDDLQAQVLARDIVKEIEEELTYPGQIRVTVVRESRASEVAR